LSEPSWLIEARKYVGQKEIPGPRHNAFILKWWGLIRAHYKDDETPWCAGFVGGCLEAVGIRSTRSASSLSFSNYGTQLLGPAVGAIAVKRRVGGGHVTFVVGIDRDGFLLCLGGNQNDSVNISRYAPEDFFTFRWPPDIKDKPIYLTLPRVSARRKTSVREA